MLISPPNDRKIKPTDAAALTRKMNLMIALLFAFGWVLTAVPQVSAFQEESAEQESEKEQEKEEAKSGEEEPDQEPAGEGEGEMDADKKDAEEKEQEEPAEDVWMTDAQAAADLAKEESRDMFLLFTGSDWCPPCIKLEQNVLSKAAFTKQSNKDFVMVKFDFPQNTTLPADLEKQNSDWATRFGVEGFPTVVLVDKDQLPYAFTGFREEGPDAYMAHVAELQQARKTRDEFMKQAADATGLDRARFLDQALAALDSNIVEVYYSELVEEIGTLDEDDEAGLRTKYFAQRDSEIRKAVMSNISMVARLQKPEQAIAFIDRALVEHKLPIEMMQVAYNTKLRLLRKLKKSDDANKLSDQIIEMEGLSAEARQRTIINKVFYIASLDKQDAAMAELDKFIGSSADNLLLTIAKGELYDSQGKYEDAVKSYDKALTAAASEPGILVEVVGAKADAQIELKLVDQAIATLDSIINNEGVPGKLRAEVLLHKALILREAGRRRAAILAENKAVEVVDNVREKAEIQKLVDQFRRKFEKTSDGN